MAEPIITLTDAAAERVKTLMSRAEDGVAGLRVGLSTRGCSGLSYVVEYASEAKQFEEVVEDKGVRIRSEEHTSELQSLMRSSYAVFCLNKKKLSKYTMET